MHESDVLRAAVVMLHATLEDFLRSLLIWKIDTFGRETLDKYGAELGRRDGKEKLTLGDLHPLKGKSIDEYIQEVVSAHLVKYSSFSNAHQVKTTLIECGVSKDIATTFDYATIGNMISRRHGIVHKADRDEAAQGRGNHKTKSIRLDTVKNYVSAVKDFQLFVADNLD